MKRFLAVLLVLGVAVAAKAEIIEQILVKVNGDIITKSDLELRQVAFLRQRNQQINADDLKNDEKLAKMLAEITPEVIASAVDELLLTQRGRELGWRLGDDQFKEIVDRIRKENKIETEEQFQAALKQEGITVADLRRSLERQMLVSQVQQREVMGKVSVTEEEERAYFESHAADFTSAAAITLREILVQVAEPDKTKGLNVGADEDAKEKAEAIRARLVAGEDFAKVAAEVSDAPSKANGGLIGPLNRTEVAPALLERLQKMKTGEVSEVLRTARGYQLIKLESTTEATTQPFESVRSAIADKVFASKRDAEFGQYLDRLRAQAIIEWKSDELRKMYEQRVPPTAKPQGETAPR